MSTTVHRPLLSLLLVLGLGCLKPLQAEITAEEVLAAIERGKNYLLRSQNSDGSWSGLDNLYPGGVTALSVLAMVNSGVSPDNPAIRKALENLRRLETDRTYVIAVQTMAFATASPQEDFLRIQKNVAWLERAQIKQGPTAGMWAYGHQNAQGGDHSNTQFALLALRDAAEIGIEVDPLVWQRAQLMWRDTQKPDGGWGYRVWPSSGSMTAAGIASLVITGAQLDDGHERIDREGNITRCGQYEQNQSLKRGMAWLGKHFSVVRNPSEGANTWWLYYMYGLERAGRLSGQRFFGRSDWYREGADILVHSGAQDRLSGAWQGAGGFEGLERQNRALSTSFALLFLSKGKSPVVINKLQYGNDDDWNNDRDDVRHLTDFLSQHWKRPLHERLTWQSVNLEAATVEDLLQAPIVYFNGHESPEFSEKQEELLREYVAEGGTIFAEACCASEPFHEGFRALVERMFPEPEYALKPLPADHPLWRAEFLLDPTSSSPLLGVDFGCRTAVIYSPKDLSCFWEQWSTQPDKKEEYLRPMIDKALSMGTNVVAYATGQEFADKLTPRETFASADVPAPVGNRGVLQIAQLRHTGGYDSAPNALHNLVVALHRTVPGMRVDPNPPSVAVLDPQLKMHPVVYMHGKSAFRFSTAEIDQLREYLRNGGVLLADATCGSEPFDRSFRELCQQLYSDARLERIAPDHAIFKSADAGGAWFDLSEVTRREPQRTGPNEPLRSITQTGEPILEGIQREDRYVVIYSPYDISCALERSRSVQCKGYVHEDALRIAINAVIYAVHFQ